MKLYLSFDLTLLLYKIVSLGLLYRNIAKERYDIMPFAIAIGSPKHKQHLGLINNIKNPKIIDKK